MHYNMQEENVNYFEDDNETNLCIVCCSIVKVNSAQNISEDSLLATNLNVIFLLRNLLQVPDSQLEDNLVECGDPVNWLIRVCEDCRELTRQAKELHWKVVKIKEQLRSVQQLILEKATKPLPPPLTADKTKFIGNCKRKEIWRKTKAFISTNDYGSLNLVNPFIEGDKLASYLECQQGSAATTLILLDKRVSSLEKCESEEVGVKVEVDNLEDDNWESPPPEPEVDEDLRPTTKKTKTSNSRKRTRVERMKYIKVNGKFKCPSCDKVFKKLSSVYLHERDKHLGPDVPHPCKLCGKMYATPNTLAIHIKLVHKKEHKRCCHLCPRKFADQRQLNVHLLARHKDDPQTLKLVEMGYQLFRCRISGCSGVALNQTEMDKHMERKHGSDDNCQSNQQPKKFPCQFCSKVFKSKDNLKRHQFTVHDTAEEKPFKCDICGFPASTLEHWSRHMRRIHFVPRQDNRAEDKISSGNDKRNKKVCHLCGQTCVSPSALKIHLVRKHREDPFAKQLIEEGYQVLKCKVPGCKVKYREESKMKEHFEEVHGGRVEISYFCAFCGKGFYVEEVLKRHEALVHGNICLEKRFKCEVCEYETRFQQYLTRHKRVVHSKPGKDGGEVVICTICGIQFGNKWKLEKHKLVHDKEGVKPHKCDLCGRSYGSQTTMWKHKRKIHKIYRRLPDKSSVKK